MATSSSKNFELDVADYVEEAFERCGIELRTGYDLKSATRSLNLMLAEWANRGLNQWTITEKTVTMVKDTKTYNVDSTNATAPIDVLDVFIRETVSNETTDLPMTRLSRAEYAHITTKSTTGRPTQYFLDRQITPNLKIYPAPENSTDVLVYDALTRMQDADTQVNTLEIPFRFFPCLTAGLAYYIAMKRAPDRIQLLKTVYEEEFESAMAEDRDRSAFNVTPKLDYYKVG